jgi:antitoxin CptB
MTVTGKVAAATGSVKQRCPPTHKVSKAKRMVSDLDTRRRRAHWRAGHRGTKEMDLLLGRYADAHLPTLEGEALARFERFLDQPDPELQTAIMTGAPHPDPDTAVLIRDIRIFHKLEPAS